MIFRSKENKFIFINESQFKNDKELYKFIRNQKFGIPNTSHINYNDRIINIIKKRPYM